MQKYFILVLPVPFSTAAQFLIKQKAMLQEWKSAAWLLAKSVSAIFWNKLFGFWQAAGAALGHFVSSPTAFW